MQTDTISMGALLLFAVLVGLFCGTGIALWFTVRCVKETVVIGESVDEEQQYFKEPIHIISQEDKKDF